MSLGGIPGELRILNSHNKMSCKPIAGSVTSINCHIVAQFTSLSATYSREKDRTAIKIA